MATTEYSKANDPQKFQFAASIRVFEDPKLQGICDRLKAENPHKREDDLGFNAFTLVSDIFYRENFHSDVLAACLDMRGAHGEKTLFLGQFIKLLKRCSPNLSASINPSDFLEYETHREEGRIDIRILDVDRGKAIIVENKINNACDQPRQIPDYVEKTEAGGYVVVAIVYLSLDGGKYPAQDNWTEAEKVSIGRRLIRVAGCPNGKQPGLLKDWVLPCQQATSNTDAVAILRQYGRLLQYLAGNESSFTIMKEFYEWVQQPGNHKSVVAVSQLLEQLPAYLCKMIMERYQAPACAPFDRVWLWPSPQKPKSAVFEGFNYGKSPLAIDINCLTDKFFVQVFERKSGDIEIAKHALSEAGLSDEFKFDEGARRFVKVLEFPSQQQELFDFIDKQLLPAFRSLKSRS